MIIDKLENKERQPGTKCASDPKPCLFKSTCEIHCVMAYGQATPTAQGGKGQMKYAVTNGVMRECSSEPQKDTRHRHAYGQSIASSYHPISSLASPQVRERFSSRDSLRPSRLERRLRSAQRNASAPESLGHSIMLWLIEITCRPVRRQSLNITGL